MELNILVVGAGSRGLATGAACRAAGLSVLVLEQASSLSECAVTSKGAPGPRKTTGSDYQEQSALPQQVRTRLPACASAPDVPVRLSCRLTRLTPPQGNAHLGWRATCRDLTRGETIELAATAVVLATGWGIPDDGRWGADEATASLRGARVLPAERATVQDVLCSEQVTVVGEGIAAVDCASAVALLRDGQGVALVRQLQTQVDASPCSSGSAAEAGDCSRSHARTVDGTALLADARRRARYTALQPHYSAPQPGPLARALRAPASRLFWTRSTRKLPRPPTGTKADKGSAAGCGSAGLKGAPDYSASSEVEKAVQSAAADSGGHLVLMCPSLANPRVLPFLDPDLRRALLGGPDGGCGELLLYRGMLHPEVRGLAFVGLPCSPSSPLPLLELQAQWLAAHLAACSRMPHPEHMRADVARQRAWRSRALASHLSTTHGSLAAAAQRAYAQQLLQDMEGVVALDPSLRGSLQRVLAVGINRDSPFGCCFGGLPAAEVMSAAADGVCVRPGNVSASTIPAPSTPLVTPPPPKRVPSHVNVSPHAATSAQVTADVLSSGDVPAGAIGAVVRPLAPPVLEPDRQLGPTRPADMKASGEQQQEQQQENPAKEQRQSPAKEQQGLQLPYSQSCRLIAEPHFAEPGSALSFSADLPVVAVRLEADVDSAACRSLSSAAGGAAASPSPTTSAVDLGGSGSVANQDTTKRAAAGGTLACPESLPAAAPGTAPVPAAATAEAARTCDASGQVEGCTSNALGPGPGQKQAKSAVGGALASPQQQQQPSPQQQQHPLAAPRRGPRRSISFSGGFPQPSPVASSKAPAQRRPPPRRGSLLGWRPAATAAANGGTNGAAAIASGGAGGALDTLQLQIEALRSHLQNPDAVPFPNFAVPRPASPPPPPPVLARAADPPPVRSTGAAPTTALFAGFAALEERLTTIPEQQPPCSEAEAHRQSEPLLKTPVIQRQPAVDSAAAATRSHQSTRPQQPSRPPKRAPRRSISCSGSFPSPGSGSAAAAAVATDAVQRRPPQRRFSLLGWRGGAAASPVGSPLGVSSPLARQVRSPNQVGSPDIMVQIGSPAAWPAADSLQSQIEALRMHLQNPDAVPFPTISPPLSPPMPPPVAEPGPPPLAHFSGATLSTSGFLDERLAPILERLPHSHDSDSGHTGDGVADATKSQHSSDPDPICRSDGRHSASPKGNLGSPDSTRSGESWQRRLLRSRTVGNVGGEAEEAAARSAPLAPLALQPPQQLLSSSASASPRLLTLRRGVNRTSSLGASEIGSRVSAVARSAIANAVAVTEAVAGLRRGGSTQRSGLGGSGGDGGGGAGLSGSSASPPGTPLFGRNGSSGSHAAPAALGSRSRLVSTVYAGDSCLQEPQPEDLVASPRFSRPRASDMGSGAMAASAMLSGPLAAGGGSGGGGGATGAVAKPGSGARRRGVRRSISLSALLHGNASTERGRNALGGLLGDAAEAAALPYSQRIREPQKADAGSAPAAGAAGRASQRSLPDESHLLRSSSRHIDTTFPTEHGLTVPAQTPGFWPRATAATPRGSDTGAMLRPQSTVFQTAGSGLHAGGARPEIPAVADATGGSNVAAGGGGKAAPRRRGVRRSMSLSSLLTAGAAVSGAAGLGAGRRDLGGLLGQAAAAAALPYSQRNKESPKGTGVTAAAAAGGAGAAVAAPDPFRYATQQSLASDVPVGAFTSPMNTFDAALPRLGTPAESRAAAAAAAAAAAIGPLGSLCSTRDDFWSMALATAISHDQSPPPATAERQGPLLVTAASLAAAATPTALPAMTCEENDTANAQPRSFAPLPLQSSSTLEFDQRLPKTAEDYSPFSDSCLVSHFRDLAQSGEPIVSPQGNPPAAVLATRGSEAGGGGKSLLRSFISSPGRPLHQSRMSRRARSLTPTPAAPPSEAALGPPASTTASAPPLACAVPAPGPTLALPEPPRSLRPPALWKRFSWTGAWQRGSASGAGGAKLGAGVYSKPPPASHDGAALASPAVSVSPRGSAATLPSFASAMSALPTHVDDQLLNAARWSVARRGGGGGASQRGQPSRPPSPLLPLSMQPHSTSQSGKAGRGSEAGSAPNARSVGGGGRGGAGGGSAVYGEEAGEADASESGEGRRGPAWAVRRASQAKQDQLVREVSSWLREALARKAAALEAATQLPAHAHAAPQGHANTHAPVRMPDGMRRSVPGLDTWQQEAAPAAAGPWASEAGRAPGATQLFRSIQAASSSDASYSDGGGSGGGSAPLQPLMTPGDGGSGGGADAAAAQVPLALQAVRRAALQRASLNAANARHPTADSP